MEELTSGAVLFLLAAAFAAGFIDSIAGGGGLISLPALLVAGVPPHLSLGTNKCMSTCGTAFSLLLYARGKAVKWDIAVKGIPFALLGAYAGSRAALLLNPETLAGIIIFVLPFVAVLTFVRGRERGKPVSPGRAAIWARIVPVCFGIGFYDGFLGPGTGTFLLLGLYFLLKMDLVRASGTTKTFNLASNVGGLTGFLLGGSVVFALGASMALANIAGNIFGSRMAMNRGPEIVRKMLPVSLSLLLITLIARYF
ncbi:MAG: sulfite exporter TauE/SafE family protein [Desulfovibrio sp.]|jgi:uncharacterized membrane protein YfcA|nr:sulfite exporter TauE/SafE family protein [Desulfovibrio sp.]